MALGVSLLDLLVGTGVTAILLTGSFISLSDAHHYRLLRWEANRIRLEVEHDATAAVLLGKRITMTVSDGVMTSAMTGGQKLRSFEVSSNVHFEDDDVTLVFYPGATASPRSIVLYSGRHQCRVIVSLRARSRLVCH